MRAAGWTEPGGSCAAEGEAARPPDFLSSLPSSSLPPSPLLSSPPRRPSTCFPSFLPSFLPLLYFSSPLIFPPLVSFCTSAAPLPLTRGRPPLTLSLCSSSPQGGDGGLLPLPAPAAALCRGGPLHDAEPLGGPGQEAGHAALPQHAQLPERHLPVHAALQALLQRRCNVPPTPPHPQPPPPL